MLAGTILVIALFGEGYVRIRVAVAPSMEGFPTYSTFAWRRRYVKLNKEGFRDPEHSLTRDPVKPRLLLIGDSFGFGWGIRRLEDRIDNQIALQLDSQTGRQWEVLNASRPGADTLDETGFLNQMVKYKPDIVVLIYIFNDIDYLIPPRPVNALWRNRFLRFCWSNSYLFQGLYLRLRTIFYRFGHSFSGSSLVSDDLTEAEFAAYNNPETMARHLTDLAHFAEIARGAGAKVLIAPFDFAVMVQPSAVARYENFVRQVSLRGIPICSLEHEWDGFTLRDLTVSPADGHPNEKADRMASRAIADCLIGSLGH